MGLFSSGGLGSVNTAARLQTEKNTRDMAKAMRAQAQAQQEQARHAQAQAVAASSESARVQWCIDRIQHLEAELEKMRTLLAERDASGDSPSA